MKKTFFMRLFSAALLSLSFLGIVPSGMAGADDHDQTVSIGIVPFFTPEKIFALYRPFVDYLNRTTSFRWEIVLGDSHDELIKKLCDGEVSMAMLGPIPYAEARRMAPVRPIVLTLTPSGETHYHSMLITADPDIKSMSDLRGKHFAIFPRSTAAHYLPMAMIAEEGLSPAPSQIVTCNSQDRLVSCLLAGEAAAGGIKEALYRQLDDPRLRLLKTSRPLPQFVFAGTPSLPAKVEDEFVTVLLGLKPLVRQSDRELVKDWDVEIQNGFALPEQGFSLDTEELLMSVSAFLR